MKFLAYLTLAVWSAAAYFTIFPLQEDEDTFEYSFEGELVEVEPEPKPVEQSVPVIDIDVDVLVKTFAQSLENTSKEYRSDFLQFIKNAEGFSENRYVCSGGKYTIGYGFTSDGVEEAKRYGLVSKDYKLPRNIDKTDAAKFLETVYLPAVERIIDKHVRVALTEGQREALISFTYNCGEKPLKIIAAALNDKNYDITPVLKKYTYAKGKQLKGLVIRRTDEIALWNRNKMEKSLANNQ